jgi:ribosomal protein S18 acetylase RimI-like enzyme
MPQIEIRPAISSDIPLLMKIEPDCSTTHVWQMDYNSEPGQIGVSFREIRLPRPVRLEYPRSLSSMPDTWLQKDLFLVAAMGDQLVGFVTLVVDRETHTAKIADLVVAEKLRRQGIGTALVFACHEWSSKQKLHRMMLEMQAKNHAGISLARKLGYDFCGFNEHYFVIYDFAVCFSYILK